MENNTDQQLIDKSFELYPEIPVCEEPYTDRMMSTDANILQKIKRDQWLKGAKYVYDDIVSRRDLTIVSLTDTVNKLEKEVEQLRADKQYLQEAVDQWQSECGNVTKLFEGKEKEIERLKGENDILSKGFDSSTQIILKCYPPRSGKGDVRQGN